MSRKGNLHNRLLLSQPKDINVQELAITPASYSGGPGVTSQPGDRLFGVFRGFPHALHANAGKEP